MVKVHNVDLVFHDRRRVEVDRIVCRYALMLACYLVLMLVNFRQNLAFTCFLYDLFSKA